MLGKIKAALGEVKQNETRDMIIGLVMLILLLALAYSAGRGDGREQLEKEVPQLAAVSAKLDQIETAMTNNQSCAAAFLDAAGKQ